MQNPFKLALWIGILILVGIIVIAEDGKVSVSEERVETVLDNTENALSNLQRYRTGRLYDDHWCKNCGFASCTRFQEREEAARARMDEKYANGKAITPIMQYNLDKIVTSDQAGK